MMCLNVVSQRLPNPLGVGARWLGRLVDEQDGTIVIWVARWMPTLATRVKLKPGIVSAPLHPSPDGTHLVQSARQSNPNNIQDRLPGVQADNRVYLGIA